ncbi:MAG TPA: SIS domain-containing protein [Thermoplasmata archaeon]|nr:SIS domain-containing protein [Thermoplasmata archaeon]
MARSLPPTAARMRALALDLPNQLEAGFAAGRELGSGPRSARQAIMVGMGGSAIAADLVLSITDPETELPLTVARGPTLPRSVGRETWTVLASYSGQTWETLLAYDEAKRRGASLYAISSGGELARRAERDGVPHLLLPPGIPPRSALGYMVGGLLGALDPFFPESNERRVRDAAARLRTLGARLANPKGPSAEYAEALGNRVPYVYADTAFAGLARRWKTQFEENAKRLAHFDLVPELFHNALVAWDALSRAEARRRGVFLLEWSEESPATRWSFAYFDQLLRSRGVPVFRVPLAPTDRLDAILEGVAIGDHLSLFLAERAGVDPEPVAAIVRLKKAQELGGLGRTAPVAPRARRRAVARK